MPGRPIYITVAVVGYWMITCKCLVANTDCVDGIFACGDNTSMMRSVAYAVATGNIAGAMANNVLTEEEF